MNVGIIATRELASSWRGPAIAVVTIFATLVLGMAVYAGLDVAIFDTLPDVARSLIGVPEGAGVETLAYSYMLDTMGSLVLGAIAIAMGARIIAGEEAEGTLSMVLGAGSSRIRFAAWKGVALALLIMVSGALMWASAELAPVVLGIDKGDAMLAASLIHLTANALVHGFLAFAVGAVTGRRAVALAVAAFVMVFGWLLAGLLPLFDQTRSSAEFVPWTWFNGSQPLLNGVDSTHLALQLGSVFVFSVIAVMGFTHRDLRAVASSVTLLSRLRSLPVFHAVGDRFAITARSRGLFALLFSSRLALVSLISIGMFALMGVVMGPLYAAMADQLGQLSDSLPVELMAMMGAGDMSTVEGFFWGETMGLMAPIAVIVVGAAAASGGIAGQEKARHLSLVLATPVPRWRIVASAAGVMTAYIAIVSVATMSGIWIGSAIAGLGMDAAAIAGAGVQLFLLGCVYSSVALLVAAATGRPTAAIGASAGLAVVGHFSSAYLNLSEKTQNWAVLSPFHFYSADNPLVNGANGESVVVLAALSVALVAAAFPLFQRRDLRIG
ncbi:MAG: ABC transporter permease subunit [Arachnia sp.]